MYLQMNSELAKDYSSASQKIRVMTEAWVSENMFCPRCGHPRMKRFDNNKPVADFYCPLCGNQYELKSKNGFALKKVNDGAYATMIERITGMDNPDFFFMSYSKINWEVKNLFFVPKHFFTPDIIEKRRPLSASARRAGWTGCHILLDKIPSAGRIPIIEDGIEVDRANVIQKVSIADRLVISDINARGWLFDVLSCVERMAGTTFTLSEMYEFENELAVKHPDNKNIRPKIRQQLQVLRDRGMIEFLQRGVYRKTG